MGSERKERDGGVLSVVFDTGEGKGMDTQASLPKGADGI